MAFKTRSRRISVCVWRVAINKAFWAQYVADRNRLLVEAKENDAQAAGQPRRGFGADSGAGLWVSWE
jgi:hypothetical protein